jgi:hypothetical protein
MIFSAWNRAALSRYINFLVGGENRLVEIYVDGNILKDENTAVNITRVLIKALSRKRNHNGRGYFWIASKEELEIWSLNVRCGNYIRYLTVWSKVTLAYALDIWNEFTKKFQDKIGSITITKD